MKSFLLLLSILFTIDFVQAQTNSTLPFWTISNIQSKAPSKIDSVMNEVIDRGPFSASWESLKGIEYQDGLKIVKPSKMP